MVLDYSCTLVCTMENHNFPGSEQPSGLAVKQSPKAQDIFQPITGPTSCAGGPCRAEWCGQWVTEGEGRSDACSVGGEQ